MTETETKVGTTKLSQGACSDAMIQISIVLGEEAASILRELKQRGFADSDAEAVERALMSYYGQLLDRDIRLSQLSTALKRMITDG
jgi:hypothetical protein